jgi:hypothetical protein
MGNRLFCGVLHWTTFFHVHFQLRKDVTWREYYPNEMFPMDPKMEGYCANPSQVPIDVDSAKNPDVDELSPGMLTSVSIR